MVITAADVSKLRKMTGAGMMDCKRALEESNGNFDEAIDIIRKKGQAIANKRADREASEGVVLSKVAEGNKRGAIVVLNCETDFVAKNENFIVLTKSILDLGLVNNVKSLEELKETKLNGVAIKDVIVEQIGEKGKKLDLPYFDTVEAEYVSSYIHPGNKLATLVGFNLPNIDYQVGRDVAMQIAAMSPVAIDPESVPQNVIDKELEIGKELARNEGKPEDKLDMIAKGRLSAFFKESTLLEQTFVKDSKINIKQYLRQQDQDLTVTEFKRYSLNN
jgi:elongation factor Ts